MSPHFQTVLGEPNESFSSQIEMGHGIDQQRHYHKEYEILYIVNGSGTLLIADAVSNFKIDDIFFIGSNVPHMIRIDKPSAVHIPVCEVAVIHFLPEFLNFITAVPENRLIANLFSRISNGLIIKGEDILNMKKLILSLRSARYTERIIMLLQILNTIAQSEHNKIISKNTFRGSVNKSDDNRLNKIYHYTLNNFSKTITLKEVADIVHLCSNSFCRYFKSRTKRSYSSFLMEMRINHACKLLSETDYSVSVISYESGYMNLSNFNRHFKSIKGKTPLEYRKQYYLGRH